VVYVLGIALFALGILVSVSLHEFGHMLTAKRFGMNVTRYFIGYGPTLFSFRRGGTEYGIKAIPLGGFAKIQGMTTLDDEDGDRPMWTFPLWKRTVVMAGGPVAHFAFGFLLLWITVSFVGVPNPELAKPQPAVITVDAGQPAARAGLHDGDRITAFNGQPVATWDELIAALSAANPGPATVSVERDGRAVQQTVELAAGAQRPVLGVHFKQMVPDGPGRMRNIAAFCFPPAAVARPDFEQVVERYFKRFDLATRDWVQSKSVAQWERR